MNEENVAAKSPLDPRDPDRAALEHAVEVMTAHAEGLLEIDEQSLTIKYVIDPLTGRLVASVPVAVLLSGQHLLWVPEESLDALQLLLSADELAEGAATDRWRVFHGEPEHVRWAQFWIDGARHGPWVFDGDALAAPNPLAADEPGLCKSLNADKGALAALCQRFAGVVVPDPVCVGVDPRGVHVRARFGVVRIRFEEVLPAAGAVRQKLESMARAL